jgi:hypothetical protein
MRWVPNSRETVMPLTICKLMQRFHQWVAGQNLRAAERWKLCRERMLAARPGPDLPKPRDPS